MHTCTSFFVGVVVANQCFSTGDFRNSSCLKIPENVISLIIENDNWHGPYNDNYYLEIPFSALCNTNAILTNTICNLSLHL